MVATDLWGPKGVQGVEDPPDGVTVAPHLGGQLPITPGPRAPLPCRHPMYTCCCRQKLSVKIDASYIISIACKKDMCI